MKARRIVRLSGLWTALPAGIRSALPVQAKVVAIPMVKSPSRKTSKLRFSAMKHLSILSLSVVTLFLGAALAPQALAQNYYLIANDAGGSSSFYSTLVGSGSGWSLTGAGPGIAPSGALNTFEISASSSSDYLLRTNANSNNAAFASATGGAVTLPTPTLQIDAGSRFLLKGGNTTTQTITVTNLIMAGGLMDESNSQIFAGGITLDGTISNNSTWTAANTTSTISSAAGNVFTISAAITGTGNLNVGIGGSAIGFAGNTGDTGTVLLTGSNSYTGTTTVIAGTLQLGNSNALQFSTVTLGASNDLTFSPNIGTFNIGGLSGGNGFSLADTSGTATVLQVGGNNSTTTYSGVMRGSGALTMVGGGALTLTASNTYSGATTISAGTLQLGSNLALQDSPLNTTGTGTLAFSSGVNAPTFGGLSGSNSLTLPSNITALTLRHCKIIT